MSKSRSQNGFVGWYILAGIFIIGMIGVAITLISGLGTTLV